MQDTYGLDPVPRPRASTDTGSVTAEVAVVLPVLVIVLATLLWGLAAAGAALRCGEAARVAARAVARGESDEVVRAAALQAAPHGATLSVTSRDGLVRAEVVATVQPFGSVLDRLPGIPVRGEATAADEGS